MKHLCLISCYRILGNFPYRESFVLPWLWTNCLHSLSTFWVSKLFINLLKTVSHLLRILLLLLINSPASRNKRSWIVIKKICFYFMINTVYCLKMNPMGQNRPEIFLLWEKDAISSNFKNLYFVIFDIVSGLSFQKYKSRMQQLERQTRTQIASSIAQSPLFGSIIKKIGRDNTACFLILIGSITWIFGFIYPNQKNFSFALTILIRGICLLPVAYYLCKRMDFSVDYKDAKGFKDLFFRNFINTIHGIVYAIVPFYLPQFFIHTVGCIGPLLVFVIDYLKYGRKISKHQAFGVALGIIGLILTINGPFIVNAFNAQFQFHSSFENYLTDSFITKFAVSIVLVVDLVLWAYAACWTKFIPYNGFQMSFHLAIMLIVISALYYPFSQINTQKLPTYEQIVIGLFLSGFVLAICQICFSCGLSICQNTGKATIVSLTGVIVSYLLSIIRYNQSISQICIVGGCLIISGVILVVFGKQQKLDDSMRIRKGSYFSNFSYS